MAVGGGEHRPRRAPPFRLVLVERQPDRLEAAGVCALAEEPDHVGAVAVLKAFANQFVRRTLVLRVLVQRVGEGGPRTPWFRCPFPDISPVGRAPGMIFAAA